MFSVALCRVCLRGAPEVRLVQSSTARVFFTDIARLLDVPDTVELCAWCAVSVREALALLENAVHADPFLRWIHCAIRDGIAIDDNLILNARSMQKTLHSLNIKETECNEIIVNGYVEKIFKQQSTTTKKQEDGMRSDRECDFSDMDDVPLIKTKLSKEEIQVEIKSEYDEKENPQESDLLNNLVIKGAFLSEGIEIKSKYKNATSKSGKKINSKRRNKKDSNKYDDAQFEVVYLSLEKQLQELEDNKLSEKYQRARYQCEFCGLGFVIENVYKNHLDRHDKSFGPFKCDVCTLRFTTHEVLLQHALAHRRHFRCTLCGAVVRRRCHCRAHAAKCGGGGPAVVCDYCSKMFRNIYSLKQHINGVHLKEKTFICDFCEKRFTHKQKLLVHLRCHTGERPYRCDACKKTFATNSNLKAHAVIHDANRPRHYCVECDSYFKTPKGLRRHFEESSKHRDEDSLSHACSRCPMRFLSERRLAAHVDFVHLGRSTEQCSTCGKGFGSSGNLRKHIETVHEKVKRSKDKICNICGQGFALKKTLECHKLTHTGARPHACDYCSATFTQLSSKYTHTRAIHTNLKRKSQNEDAK